MTYSDYFSHKIECLALNLFSLTLVNPDNSILSLVKTKDEEEARALLEDFYYTVIDCDDTSITARIS